MAQQHGTTCDPVPDIFPSLFVGDTSTAPFSTDSLRDSALEEVQRWGLATQVKHRTTWPIGARVMSSHFHHGKNQT